MKNFLKLTSLILFLSLLLPLGKSAHAQDLAGEKAFQYGEIKQKYYEKIVSKWGFNVIEKPFEIIAIPTIEENTNSANEDKQEAKVTNPDDLIIVSDSVIYEPINLIEVKTTSNYNFIFFDSTEVPLENYLTKDLGFKLLNEAESAKYYLYENEESNSITIAINSKYLVSPKMLSNINIYFSALEKSLNPKDQSQNKKPIEVIYPDKVVLETFSYALILFLFAIVSYKTAILINTHRKNSFSIIQIEAKNILNDILEWSEKINPYAYLCLIFLIGVLAYLVILVSLTNRGDMDTSYLTEKISDLSKINLDVDVFKSRNPIHIAVLMLVRAIQVVLFIILIPRIFDFSSRVYSLKNKFPLDIVFLKHSLVILMLLVLLSVSLSDFKTNFVLPLSLTMLTLLTLIPFLKTKLPSFSKKGSLIYLGVGFMILASVILFKINDYKNPKETINDLFAADNKVIFLPYQKDIDGTHPVFIQKKIVKSNAMIFADNYLIYHPRSSLINYLELAGINKLSTSGGIILHPQNPTKMIEKLFENKALRDLYSTNITTNKIYYKKDKANYNSEHLLSLEIECWADINPQIINLSITGRNADNQKLKSKTIPVANFPGCNKGETNQRLEVAITEELYQDEYIFQIDGIETKFLKNIVLSANNQISSTSQFIDFNESDKYKIINYENNLTIYVVNLDNPQKIDLASPIQTSENGIDLSENINKLIKRGLLRDSFVIWSTEPNTLIYNKLEN